MTASQGTEAIIRYGAGIPTDDAVYLIVYDLDELRQTYLRIPVGNQLQSSHLYSIKDPQVFTNRALLLSIRPLLISLLFAVAFFMALSFCLLLL